MQTHSQLQTTAMMPLLSKMDEKFNWPKSKVPVHYVKIVKHIVRKDICIVNPTASQHVAPQVYGYYKGRK